MYSNFICIQGQKFCFKGHRCFVSVQEGVLSGVAVPLKTLLLLHLPHSLCTESPTPMYGNCVCIQGQKLCFKGHRGFVSVQEGVLSRVPVPHSLPAFYLLLSCLVFNV